MSTQVIMIGKVPGKKVAKATETKISNNKELVLLSGKSGISYQK